MQLAIVDRSLWPRSQYKNKIFSPFCLIICNNNNNRKHIIKGELKKMLIPQGFEKGSIKITRTVFFFFCILFISHRNLLKHFSRHGGCYLPKKKQP